MSAFARAVDRLAERRTLRANDRKRRRTLARWHRRGVACAEAWRSPSAVSFPADGNPLRAFVAARSEGRGIWKWDHYFDVYHRHFQRFRGEEVHILEIGIYSGGSLDMWHDYFGPKCHVYGADIQEECLSYAADRTTSSSATRPTRASGNPFAAYVYGWVQALNTFRAVPHPGEPERRMVSDTAAFQASIEGIYQYPYVVVVEKRAAALDEFVAPKRGSEWAPFLRND